jgi:hypothetical protein
MGDRFGSLPSSDAVQPPPAAGDEAGDLDAPPREPAQRVEGLYATAKILAVVSRFADLARLSDEPCFTIGPSS